MIDIRQLRQGLLMLWEQRNPLGSTTGLIPCVVAEVKEDAFGMIVMDDFRVEWVHLASSEMLLSEGLRLASEEDVRSYLQERRRLLADQVAKAQSQLEAAQERLFSYDARRDFVLATFPPKS
ncbi:MAG: hypothetical protein WC687_00445 [Patescibacteria group bacterium]|jgi:hypothetical protein